MSKKIKLSVLQRDILSRMRNGDKLHYMQGLNASCFFHKDMKNANWNSIGKLEDLGLIVRKDKYIELTELGREIEL